MTLVRAACDRVVVLNFGEVLARGTPAEIAPRSGRGRSLPRQRREAPALSACSRSRGLRAGYGNIEILHDVTIALERRHAVRDRRRQRRRQDDAADGDFRHLAKRGGTVRFDGEDVTQLPPHALVDAGCFLVPEGRRMLAR